MGPAAMAGRAVYFGSGDGSVYAVSAVDGSLLWRTELGGHVDGGVAVADVRFTVPAGNLTRNTSVEVQLD